MFLNGFMGRLYADGYQGDHKLPQSIRMAGCRVDAWRKFDDALHIIPKEQQGSDRTEQMVYFPTPDICGDLCMTNAAICASNGTDSGVAPAF